jgi:hypothetical protein
MNNVLDWSSPIFPFFWVFGWAAFVLIILYMKHRKRRQTIELIHKERMAAMEKGIPMPEWPDYDVNGKAAVCEDIRGDRKENPKGALGAGAILMMVGAGMCLAFYLWPAVRQIWPIGLIVVFTGVGVMLSYLLTKEKKD